MANQELLLERFRRYWKAARLLYKNGLYEDCVSRAYYAIFFFMWAYVGEPPAGKWKHGGLKDAFNKLLFNKGFPKEDLKAISRATSKLYNLRVRADYSIISISKQDAKDALAIMRDLTRKVRRDEVTD